MKAKDRFSNYESICLQCGVTIYKPFKELSDEEITDVFVECLLPDGEFNEHEFARAILKKASEK